MGKLFLVSTPIGNLEDISIRALKTLFKVGILLSEDTRRTGQLLELLKYKYAELTEINFENKPKLISFYEGIEMQKVPELISLLKNDQDIALVSDAGTPLISDPGFVLVREAVKRKIQVISIPGASAILTALTSSGLPANSFTFVGFPPEKTHHRINFFNDLIQIHTLSKQVKPTFIMYQAPHKLSTTFIDMQSVFGDIPITIARELTKLHEEIWTGLLSDAMIYFSDPKGEFVILFNLTK
jgi:16S rRNA (cytidine1402-2'-O)-methyltransferase